MNVIGPVPQTVVLGLAYGSRRAIETEIERLISMLDVFDGDCDLEDDDPAGDRLDSEGEAPTDDGSELLRIRPSYGADQAAGPTNERDAMRDWYRQKGIVA